MPSIYESMVIAAPAAKVWETVRDFGGMGKWHAPLVSCELEGGDPPRAGVIRRMEFPGGAFVREKLEALSDAGKSLSYSMAESNIPSAQQMIDYLGTIEVSPITDDGRTFVSWSCRYDLPAGADVEASVAGMTGAYKAMLADLRKAFA